MQHYTSKNKIHHGNRKTKHIKLLRFNITNNHNKLTFGIYRKPTNTDLIIHDDSCHPYDTKNQQ
jgi:hypothetical protein